jgi:fluoride exporter
MNPWLQYMYVGVGGALGSMARFGIGGLISQKFAQFPAGTLFVNVSGSFVIGFIAALAALAAPGSRFLISPGAREFIMIGVLGGYTTFSSFSLQTLNLAREGQVLYAILNVLASVILCLLAVWVGNGLAQMINR